MAFFQDLPHIEECPKRIRVIFSGICIIDTKKAKLVWTHPAFPNFYFSKVDLPLKHIGPALATSDPGTFLHDLTVGEGGQAAITTFHGGPLEGLFTINRFSQMDAWFEEEEQIHIHPKDPYKRVDVLQSSRHVRIEIAGVEVANTRQPRLLFETALPVRTYIPKTDCAMELWKPSPLRSGCPYKGEAHYYHVALPNGEVVENVIWWYPNTTLESSPIRGYVCFFDEKVDVWVDGVKQDRPKTKWS